MNELYVHHFINNGISPVCVGCFPQLKKAQECEHCRKAHWPKNLDDGIPIMCLDREVVIRDEYHNDDY